jgi:predicted N-acetyltransferase YhbS
MVEADLEAASRVSGVAFELDLTDARTRDRWTGRVAASLRTDPGGAFVAEQDGRVIGVVQAIRRDERLWVLSLLTVDPKVQSGGAGRGLLGAALGYAHESDHGLIVSSSDYRALRIYALAGFAPHPAFHATGTIDRAALPAPDPRVQALEANQLGRLDPVARAVRGASYARELPDLLEEGGRILAFGERGYVALTDRWGVWGLVAQDAEAASALLWTALAEVENPPSAPVRWLTGQQQWAIGIVLRAGLMLELHGALCVRGKPGTLSPFIPTGQFA